MRIKPRILVVVDNEEYRASIKDVLTENGCNIECANNDKEAIALSQNNKYDIAIVDIKLPDISGADHRFFIQNYLLKSPFNLFCKAFDGFKM